MPGVVLAWPGVSTRPLKVHSIATVVTRQRQAAGYSAADRRGNTQLGRTKWQV
ncbi:hypothetical protein ABIA14_005705 [Sinorhizobium fredii]